MEGFASREFPVPFDTSGNQLLRPLKAGEFLLRTNRPFKSTLRFTGVVGAVRPYFSFTRPDGRDVVVLMADFTDMLPKMVEGEISGTFEFVRRGRHFGCRLALPLAPEDKVDDDLAAPASQPLEMPVAQPVEPARRPILTLPEKRSAA
ncbi:hypothetical protein [Herbaspirillum huttiense]|uniref:DUF35 domain-containing protein n=1 Tax=Herbaspirillum huttiense subsp. lycopersici TaxID=3074428 RepID=A0ABU2EG28_9BURK|nr:hypothetical protein [Herbaspirillum huttiense]MDR9847097.1 hypothetical protein [Herbaspirillum huttiense SE1]